MPENCVFNHSIFFESDYVVVTRNEQQNAQLCITVHREYIDPQSGSRAIYAFSRSVSYKELSPKLQHDAAKIVTETTLRRGNCYLHI